MKQVVYGCLLPALVSCAATTDGTSGSGAGQAQGAADPQGGNAIITAGGAGAGIAGTGGDGAGTPSNQNCSDAAEFVYVLSQSNVLQQFDPSKKQFTSVGSLKCSTGSAEPNSMAVNRDAKAWVNYVTSDFLLGETNGALYLVDTKDGSCVGPRIDLPQGWFRVGMGFSTNEAGSEDETLYVVSILTGGLASINTQTGVLTELGTVGGTPELTGNAKADLFAFFPTSPAGLSQLDKQSGSKLSTKSLDGIGVGVGASSAWAFSFWGGRFYFYTSSGSNSKVSEYDPETGTIDANFMADAGSLIIGAGVSTCAPIAPPK